MYGVMYCITYRCISSHDETVRLLPGILVSIQLIPYASMYSHFYLAYEITIKTSDKKDGGMMHNAWLILEGEKRKSKQFVMKNSPVHKVFRKGNTDTFTMESRYLGKLTRIVLGAAQREDKQLGRKLGITVIRQT